MEGHLGDHSVGRWEGRMEGHLGDHSVGRSVDPRADRTEVQREGRLVGRSGRMMEVAIRGQVVLLPLVAQGPQYRRKHRQACCRVGTSLRHLALFLQKSFLSPRWHPFHPHGAA